jgi:hypothetical protein
MRAANTVLIFNNSCNYPVSFTIFRRLQGFRTLEPLECLKNAEDAINRFHIRYPNPPRFSRLDDVQSLRFINHRLSLLDLVNLRIHVFFSSLVVYIIFSLNTKSLGIVHPSRSASGSNGARSLRE